MLLRVLYNLVISDCGYVSLSALIVAMRLVGDLWGIHCFLSCQVVINGDMRNVHIRIIFTALPAGILVGILKEPVTSNSLAIKMRPSARCFFSISNASLRDFFSGSVENQGAVPQIAAVSQYWRCGIKRVCKIGKEYGWPSVHFFGDSCHRFVRRIVFQWRRTRDLRFQAYNTLLFIRREKVATEHVPFCDICHCGHYCS